MKKLLLFSVIASAMSYSASLSVSSEANYDGKVKFSFGSEFNVKNKNVSGQSSLKLGDYTVLEKNEFLKNASLKNKYDFKVNLTNRVNLLAKTELNLEKAGEDKTTSYRLEPGFELNYTVKPYALFSLKGVNKKVDKGIKLGLNYENDNFSNDLEFGAWYLSKLEANDSFGLPEYISLENTGDYGMIEVIKKLGNHENFKYEIFKKLLLLNDDPSKHNISTAYKPYELSLKDSLRYKKGNFETKNTVSVNYINKDLSTVIKVPSKNQNLEGISEPFVFNGKTHLSELVLNTKSQNSYKLSDYATVKLDLENEFKNLSTGSLKEAKVNRYLLTGIDVRTSKIEFRLLNANHYTNYMKNEKTNNFSAKLALNYVNQIDEKNKLILEPSVKLGIGHNLVKVTEETKNMNNDYEVINNSMKIENNSVSFSVSPRIEGTYESKLNDNLTVSFKPYLELNFNSTINKEKYNTIKVDVVRLDEGFVNYRDQIIVIPTEISDKTLKEKIKNGEEVKYGVTEKSVKALSFDSVKTGVKLELKYTW